MVNDALKINKSKERENALKYAEHELNKLKEHFMVDDIAEHELKEQILLINKLEKMENKIRAKPTTSTSKNSSYHGPSTKTEVHQIDQSQHLQQQRRSNRAQKYSINEYLVQLQQHQKELNQKKDKFNELDKLRRDRQNW